MASHRITGATPLDRLAARYEPELLACARCGHVDEDGAVHGRTDGSEVRYEHVCPSCGSVGTRTLRLGRGR